MLEFILADLLADLPPTMTSHTQDEFNLADLLPKINNNNFNTSWYIYIMGCIWQPFWILQEKVEFLFISE